MQNEHLASYKRSGFAKILTVESSLYEYILLRVQCSISSIIAPSGYQSRTER